MPSGHKTSDVPSKYQPLFDLLAATTGDEVVLTYKELAALISGPLPEAIFTSSWWTSTRLAHVQVWQAMGWRAHGSPGKLRVRFTRDAEDRSTPSATALPRGGESE